MNKRDALVLSLLFTSLLFFNIFSFSTLHPARVERAVVLRAIDGDTLELSDGRVIRLLNINSPEKNDPGSYLAFDFLKKFENKTLSFKVYNLDKYGRSLAQVYSKDYLNLEIVKKGYANKYLVADSEKRKYANAEDDAISSQRGMWKKSRHFGCVKIDIHPKEEKIIILNKCTSFSLMGSRLKDEGRKIYTFKNNYRKIVLNSQKGTDNSSDIFWNSNVNIWNDDADSLYLFDKEGNLVFHTDYGYW